MFRERERSGFRNEQIKTESEVNKDGNMNYGLEDVV